VLPCIVSQSWVRAVKAGGISKRGIWEQTPVALMESHIGSTWRGDATLKGTAMDLFTEERIELGCKHPNERKTETDYPELAPRPIRRMTWTCKDCGRVRPRVP